LYARRLSVNRSSVERRRARAASAAPQQLAPSGWTHPRHRVVRVAFVSALAAATIIGAGGPRTGKPVATAPTAAVASIGPITKVLTIVEENHSLAQMKVGMPYLYGLAQRYGYANNWAAIRHPSLPNYLAVAGGDTFGVVDDGPPSAHPGPRIECLRAGEERRQDREGLRRGNDKQLHDHQHGSLRREAQPVGVLRR
jgi:hypothetical protein